MKILVLSMTTNESKLDAKTSKYDMPRMAEVSWLVVDEDNKVLEIEKSHYVRPDENFKKVSAKAKAYNGLSLEFLRDKGEDLKLLLSKLYIAIAKADYIVGANMWFMKKVLVNEMETYFPGKNFKTYLVNTTQFDVLDSARQLVGAKYSGTKAGVRRPTLKETVKKLTNVDIEDKYDSTTINYVFQCYAILKKLSIIRL